MDIIQVQEKDYGTELGVIRRAPVSTTVHPLEAIEKNRKNTEENLEIEKARKVFGLGFALHLQHERVITRSHDIGHFGFLTRSNAMHQSLTGQDLQFDFSDVLNIEPEVTRTPYLALESSRNKLYFKK